MTRPAEREEAKAWDMRKAREHIALLEDEFPITAMGLRRQMHEYEKYSPGGLYGFVLELAVISHALVNR